MILKEKERAALEDLQTQEKSCVEKYEKYANQAKDPELKSLFRTLQKEEQKHYDSLGQVLAGTVPECSWFPENTIRTSLYLEKAVSVSFLPTFRLKNRIMRRCFINTSWQTECSKGQT